MSDQRPGGGYESGHVSAHNRTNSVENETLAKESTAETRNAAPEPERQSILPAQSQPLAPRRLSSSTPTPTPAAIAAPTLSPLDSSQTLSRSNSPERRQTRPQRVEPPVTKMTLSELDVNKIIQNPKLRHDINFDPELHFRPNFDGEKGRRKQEKANQFWTALHDQLYQFVLDRQGFRERYPNDEEWCLPLLLRAVKDIIQTLVPHKDRECLDEGLNIELLMQQFDKGVADLERLASWLSGVLKRHCAPMRDEWVDEMYNELSSGNRNNDMAELVRGMRTLLSILEAMKLDVANHQIRCLRPVLIEDTVHFEQRFFLKKIQAGRLNMDAARSWFRRVQEIAVQDDDILRPHAQSFGETAAFFGALSRFLLPSAVAEGVTSGLLPNTFLFDEDRILKLRSDLHDSICFEICMRQYEQLEAMSRFPASLQTVPFYVVDDSYVEGGSGEMNYNAPHGSRPSSFVWSDSDSAVASPRNSGCLAGAPSTDAVDPSLKTRRVYDSLLALLQTAPPVSRPTQKWQGGLAQSMALQIMRYVNVPHITATEFEEHLANQLNDVHGDVFRTIEDYYHKRLVVGLAKHVKEFRNLSGVGLFSLATGGRIQAPGRTWDASRDKSQRERELLDNVSSGRDPRGDGNVDDMATRLAHLGILHWRVWAQLAYVDDGLDSGYSLDTLTA